MQNAASLLPLGRLLRRLAGALLIEASLAHGVAAVAAVVAEITVAGAARRQVITVVALAAQVHLSGSIRLSQSAYHGVYHVVVPFGQAARPIRLGTAYMLISVDHWIFYLVIFSEDSEKNF
jgi:hypothetical protein